MRYFFVFANLVSVEDKDKSVLCPDGNEVGGCHAGGKS
jgi:hypothetical protein